MPTRARQSRTRLVRPPSKQILQIREDAEWSARDADGLGASPYPCASPTWSSSAKECSSPHNAADTADESNAESAAGGGHRVHSSSPPQCTVSSRHESKVDDVDDGDDDAAAAATAHHHASEQHNTTAHAPHRAMTASARRGGKSARKSNGHSPRSRSSRAYLSSSSRTRQPQQQQQQPRSIGGRVTYYGPPPATALVSPTHSSPASSPKLSEASTSANTTITNEINRGGATRMTHNLNGTSHAASYGDAGAPKTQTTAADVTDGDASPSHSASDKASTTPGCPSRLSSAASTSSPPTIGAAKTSDTPLTYAAVASASSCSSSLHGKRLPQSRVGFGNFRKRVGSAGGGGGGESCGSGNASVGSTAHSTQGTPARLFSDHHTGNSYSTRGYCASSCGFPSVPLTPLTANAPSHAAPAAGGGGEMNGPAGGTGKDTPASMSPHATTRADTTAVGTEGGAAVYGEEVDNEDDESDGDGWRSLHHHHHNHQQQQQQQQLMPPIPPSLHRHHPTNLYLQLHHAHRPNPESDEEEASASERTVSHQAPSQSPAAPAVAASASTQVKEDLDRCSTSNTKHHTGPATAAKAAAGLHILPIASAAPSASSTPCVPAVSEQRQQQQQQQQQDRSLQPLQIAPRTSLDAFSPLSAPSETTPTGPAPPTISNTGKGMHKVSSTMSFFNAVEIIPGLFLGSYGDATDTEALATHGISLVINCSLECAVTPTMANNSYHVRYIQCPLRDHSDEIISPFFGPVTQIIHEQLHRRQIHQQHTKMLKSGSATAAAATASFNGCAAPSVSKAGKRDDTEDRLCEEKAVTCRCCSCCQTTPKTTGVDALGGELQDRMGWTWADEAANVWAVPASPASPALSVGGQPSLKEGKRETPRTPSSAVIAAGWGGGSEGNTSLCTSGSPSPMPGRTATFPGVSVGSASTPMAAADLLVNPTAKATPFSTPAATSNNSSNTNNNNSNTAAAASTTSLTVVDPRDCGGVLVHCRMGVSRSATFVMAYLILYGFTMANLEDTASLFVRFLERERQIIEDAGGRARFGSDVSGGSGGSATVATPAQTSAIATTAAAATPTSESHANANKSSNNTQAFGSPLFKSSSLFRNTSLAPSSRFSTAVSSPTGSGGMTPAHTPLGLRRATNGPAPWHSLPSVNNASVTSLSSTSGRNGIGGGLTNGSPALASHRRSVAIPVSSPLFLNNSVSGHAASPRSVTSSSLMRLYTPLTPLEACSRVCRPCHLLRLRERRLQQQAKKHLLISGARQQQQQQREEEEEEEQMIALAALSRLRRNGGSAHSGKNGEEARLGAEEEGESERCANCGDGIHCTHGTRSQETMTPQRTFDQQRQQQSYSFTLRPTPSSAPVVSHRGARGSLGLRRTLLETAQDDDEVHRRAAADQCDGIEDQDDDEKRDAEACGAETEARMSVADSVPMRNAFSVSKASAAAAAAAAAAATTAEASDAPWTGTSITGQPPLGASSCSDLPPQTSNGNASGGTVALNRGATAAASHNNNNNNCLYASCDNSSLSSSHSMYSGDLAPAMTFREAFDAVKKEKSDVNPNIGFVLALRELAGGGDFSFSTSL